VDVADASCRVVARLSLLSKVGALAGTLDYDAVLSAVARLSIPELADWCVVDVVEDGEMRRMEVAHRDPSRAPLAAALRAFPLDHSARRRLPVARALQTREPVLIPDYTEEMLRAEAEREYFEVARHLQVCSVLVIPVTLPSSLATMAFMTTVESGRRYGPDDVAVADELVRRAAQLVENARVHQKLRQTEERFRVALAHSAITLFEQDAERRYRWIYNPPFGYAPEEVLGRTNEELVTPEEAARLEVLDRAVLERGARVHEEIRISEPGGETRHLLLSQEPLCDAAGKIVGLTGAATDITEQKRAQEELAQALAFREQMLGILGHDLQNPLGAVRALATLLLRREGLPEKVRESIAEIERAGQRMLELIGTLLDFTRSREGGLPIAPVRADLRDVCRGVVDELRAAEPGRTITLEVDGDARGTWDPARLAQAVSNLVANALEHGAADRPVHVSVEGEAEVVVLRVHNDGPAIPAPVAEVMFEPFCRGSALRDGAHVRGLGLGLYIVRQVVTAHGGTMAVDSTAARGTTFTVRLPRASEAHRAGAHGARDEGAAAGA
jgi:PAS domain S-box-containing protein